MTPLAPLGFYVIKKGHHHIGAAILIVYGVCNILTLGHYNYAPINSIAMKIHLFIALEAIMGCILIGYILLLYKIRFVLLLVNSLCIIYYKDKIEYLSSQRIGTFKRYHQRRHTTSNDF